MKFKRHTNDKWYAAAQSEDSDRIGKDGIFLVVSFYSAIGFYIGHIKDHGISVSRSLSDAVRNDIDAVGILCFDVEQVLFIRANVDEAQICVF